MRAIIFSRVSTKVQTLEQQTDKLIEEAYKRGYDDSSIIVIQEKESGSKLLASERIGLVKLKDVLDTYSDIDCIIIYELSRLSRRPADLYQIRDYLLSKHVNLISLTPYMELLDENGNFNSMASVIFGIYSSLSEQEGYLRIERIMRGKEKKKSEGKLSTGKPRIGYALDKDKYPIPHPKYAPVIREIFERFSTMESSGSIGKDLFLRNALPVKTDKVVTYQTYIADILRDGRYAHIDENSIYPPLVSKELFYKVQDILSNKKKYFVRKSNTKETYPLQGFIYTDDRYKLVPSISNNRYLKMRCNGTNHPLSLNMKAVHTLSKYIMNKYLSSGVLESDREKERAELQEKRAKNEIILSNIDNKILALQRENDIINSRIIKGRLSETKGDALIDNNIKEIYSLEDKRQELEYENVKIYDKLSYLANPLFTNVNSGEINTDDELKEAVNKYLEKVNVAKIGFSKYTLTYIFKDSTVLSGSFYSTSHGVEYYDSDWNVIK